jgi:hypothetical protein
VLASDLDLASRNPEQRVAVDDEPGHAGDATRLPTAEKQRPGSLFRTAQSPYPEDMSRLTAKVEPNGQ